MAVIAPLICNTARLRKLHEELTSHITRTAGRFWGFLWCFRTYNPVHNTLLYIYKVQDSWGWVILLSTTMIRLTHRWAGRDVSVFSDVMTDYARICFRKAFHWTILNWKRANLTELDMSESTCYETPFFQFCVPYSHLLWRKFTAEIVSFCGPLHYRTASVLFNWAIPNSAGAAFRS